MALAVRIHTRTRCAHRDAGTLRCSRKVNFSQYDLLLKFKEYVSEVLALNGNVWFEAKHLMVLRLLLYAYPGVKEAVIVTEQLVLPLMQTTDRLVRIGRATLLSTS